VDQQGLKTELLFLEASATHFLLELCAPWVGGKGCLPGPLKQPVADV
jgi:hypothetical protein